VQARMKLAREGNDFFRHVLSYAGD
jgi:hypothetical protein